MRLALNFFRVDPGRGGAETYVADLARALDAAGHRVDLLAHDWRDDALPDGVRRVRVPAAGRTRRQRLWDFAVQSEALLRRPDYDCTVGFINTWHHDVIIPQGGVHAASLEANARRFPAGWRRLYLAAKWFNPKAWTYQTIERRQYDPARGAHVVAVSNYVRGHLERYHGVPRQRIHVIPNAIDAGRLAVADPVAARRGFRSRLGIPGDALVALFVAHNFRLKGLGPLLEALALRLRRDPAARPIHLLACGGGRPGAFRRQANRLGLGDVVHFAGFVPEVAEAYAASDFFVLPTYYDPCSLVVFEALARGLPVITTACNGAGEVMTPGREGFVVRSPDAPDHLADALDRMADDAARLEMAGHAERLGRAQSFDAHVARLVALFEDVAAAKAGSRPVAAA
ncbi:MAG TPA: glycosyltransferase family 4 protein [Isosphaeraceae bacterium]|jgi:UDP-glucose:(heptosyl)LPS alpha-1,3-glucosyltransferase|nr:glycosyltransferase family 4 protein [Isosphaeraceae bacterium]